MGAQEWGKRGSREERRKRLTGGAHARPYNRYFDRCHGVRFTIERVKWRKSRVGSPGGGEDQVDLALVTCI